MEALQKRINNLTAREVNGVYKPLMEPGREIEYAVEDIRDMLDAILDDGIEYVDAARSHINDLRRKYNGNNNLRVSNGIAKGVADRADAILNDIMALKTKRPRGGSPEVTRKTRKSRKSKKQRKAKKSRKL